MTLDIITAATLAATRHGFFTRTGGASTGVFAELNCGAGSGDQNDAVSINRARVAKAINVAPANLVALHQVHSARVVTVTGRQFETIQADAMVTNQPDLALAIKTADCQPVLLADTAAGVIGAAHAGWRGALLGVLEATVDAMQSLGADRANISAVIGPTISQRSYEVGPAFRDEFLAQDPDYARYFIPGKGDRLQFDLPAFGLNRLRAANIGHAEWTGQCTYADEARFFSYRRSVHRNQADYGRHMSVICL